ncbi:MAG: hypothetical protein J2P28_26985, partial [Actinobacteria bacterium]|nr:hypothetical protein [Actinomycetota bacterium]
MLAALAVLAVLTLLLTGIRVQPMPLPATDARATAGAQVGASAAARYPLSVGWLQDHTAPAVDVKGLSAILIDVRTREVLWERDPDSARAPASLTKLVTAMVVADHVRSLDQPVTVAPGADVLAIQQIEPESTVMGIHAGEVWTVRELLTGLFLLSGNDA